MKFPLKVKSRRGRPPQIQKNDSLKGLKQKKAACFGLLEESRPTSQCYIEVLHKTGALTFNHVQAVQEFWRLYRVYLSVLGGPRCARVSFGGSDGRKLSESKIESNLCLWRRTQSVLRPFGLQGEQLLKKVCEESFSAMHLTGKELSTLKEMAHVLFKFYTLNKYCARQS